MTENQAPHTKGQHLNDIEIAKVLGLNKGGKSLREIASLMHCTPKPIRNALANYDFDTFQGRDTRREYKRKMTKWEDQYIERALKQNFDVPLRDITNIIDSEISEKTLRRHRSEAGLERYVAAVKPGLRSVNVAARLEWALRYKNWTVED